MMELICKTRANKIRARWQTEERRDIMVVSFGDEFDLRLDKSQARKLYEELNHKINWR